MASVGTWFATLTRMETTADHVGLRHDRALTTPVSRGVSAAASHIIRTRYITTAIVSGLYVALSAVMLGLFGMAVLPMFVIALPFAMVLFWETANELRSDELRDAHQRKTAPARMPRPLVNTRAR